MKKLLFTAVAVFAFGFVNAQESSAEGFGKGSMFLSGTVSFGTNDLKSLDAKETSFVVAPKFGYFVSENIAVGVGLGFGNSQIKANSNNQKIENKTTSFGAFGRYYLKTSKFAPFAELNVNYANTNTEYVRFLGQVAPIGVNSPDIITFSANVAPGFNYFISDNFALETSVGIIGYSNSKMDVSGAKADSGFNIGLDLTNINFGLVYKF
ncbi:outer membrane protein [Flavobacterium luminosum]|uniref:Porin family protein n=1 Tax=Flavobacterium luminosum TaxID=2949086 RepID=A0ABT0TK17_9FLAO|nr:outer membrane beta-barrel protein [Flavobacterium sp. HXWNR70]MCL9807830.1 porin family protein [Flavobacterium sp. HXWNR70]